MVSVIRMPATQAFEFCLCRTILRFAVSADRAGLTRIGRRHFYDGSAIELSFPVEFGKEEPPTLIEYGSVETALLLHMSARFGICQDTSKKLVRSLFIPEEPQQGLCPYASLPQDIFLT